MSPLPPSKRLMKVLDRIRFSGDAPIFDAPSGFGRNALALADKGYDVVAVDKAPDRLKSLKMSVASRGYGKEGTSTGNVLTLCADLENGRLPFRGSLFSAVVCVHYPVQRIILDLKAVVRSGGYFYIETFQGHGMNYLELPKTKEILDALQDWEILTYNETSVGPQCEQAVVVEALARNC
jgi:SAM-dependent methyltransferase